MIELNKDLYKDYINKIKGSSDREYLTSTILYNIAPTIAKIKPATIITLSRNVRELNKLWEIYKDDFCKEFGTNYYEIKKTDKAINVLFFNTEYLINTIYDEKHMDYLKTFGYNQNMTLLECIQHLSKRFENTCPHEIGIFLGIPLDDVKTFIEHPTRECLLCGYWKVYFNTRESKEKFEKYDKAKAMF